MSVQQFEMEMEVDRQMFYNEDSTFGIYALRPVHYTRELPMNSFGNVSVQGTTRRLQEGEQYLVKFEGTFSHPKYGSFYKIVSVAPDKLNTVSDQDRFLRFILTEAQFKSLKDAYPDDLLVDLITEDKIDVSKTKGIKKKSLAKIKEIVVKNTSISLLISRLVDLELTTSAIDKLLEHFGSAETVLRKIDEDIYNLCDVRGFGFLSVDKAALRRGDDPLSKHRLGACIKFILKKDNDGGHTWSMRHVLIEDATDMLNVNRLLVEDFVEEMGSSREFYVEGNRVAFSSLRNKEQEIYKHLKRIRDNYSPPIVANIEKYKLEELELQQGFKFTEEQRSTVLEGSKHGVMSVNGKGGTGKTTIIKGIIESTDNFNYITVALSGKAVQVLAKSGVASSTIHRMLGRNTETGGFKYNEENPLGYDTVVIDEMSMVNIDLFLAVVRAIPDGSKLIMSGDSGQLVGIGAGCLLRDLLEVEVFPSFELTQVHRQAAKSGILSLANTIREGQQVMPYNASGREVYGELKDQTLISYSNKGSIPYDILAIAEAYKEKIKSPQDLLDFQVLSPTRESGEMSVRNINIELQQVFNDIKKPYLSRNGYNFREGDKIIAQGNSYEQCVFKNVEKYFEYIELLENLDLEDEEDASRLPNIAEVDVFNGTMGFIVCVDVEEKMVFIQFEGINGLVPMSQGEMEKIDMAYAITIHKSQGSTIKNVITAISFDAYTLLSRQLIYTALTRASEKGLLLCENNALVSAINNDSSETRRTFLRDIIRDDIG